MGEIINWQTVPHGRQVKNFKKTTNVRVYKHVLKETSVIFS